MSHHRTTRVAVVINPISGVGDRPGRSQRLLGEAVQLLEARGYEPAVFLTERAGHARELASAAIRQGATTVIAWGGDGTVNEVASALSFGPGRLGIVPSGSGNGLARELGVPLDPRRALDVALGDTDATIDVGELGGRLFVNVAGVGFDARIAQQFAAVGHTRRGLIRYAEIVVRELLTYEPKPCTLVLSEGTWSQRPLLIAFANGRQYGNGAVIAPHARLNDGVLDIVTVAHRSVMGTFMCLPKLFGGKADRVGGVAVRRAERFVLRADQPILFHVDGEPVEGGALLEGRVHPAALRVCVPPRPVD